MPLPDFNQEGLLPDGIHPASETEFRERCVEPFRKSVSRKPVFDGFRRYRSDIANLGLNTTQWVNGSFTDAQREDPDDIDLINFCTDAEINQVKPPYRPKLEALLNGKKQTKAVYHCHTFLVEFPVGHPFNVSFESQRRYWRKWFSTPQDYSNPPFKTPAPHRGKKGIVEMVIGDPTRAPKIDRSF